VRSLFTGLVVLACAAGLSAQEEKKFTSKEGKFAAKFPGEPKTVNQKVKDLDMVITIVEKGKSGFAVIFADLPELAVKAGADKVLEGGENGMLNNTKAKLIKSKETKFKSNGKEFPAREILAEKLADKQTQKEDQYVRVTLILAEARLYQVLVVGEKDIVTGKEADAFIASFDIAK
jgi:hypothetical protein